MIDRGIAANWSRSIDDELRPIGFSKCHKRQVETLNQTFAAVLAPAINLAE